jgi:hypothetical protein
MIKIRDTMHGKLMNDDESLRSIRQKCSCLTLERSNEISWPALSCTSGIRQRDESALARERRMEREEINNARDMRRARAEGRESLIRDVVSFTGRKSLKNVFLAYVWRTAGRRLRFDATSPRLHVGSRGSEQKRPDVRRPRTRAVPSPCSPRGAALYRDNESEVVQSRRENGDATEVAREFSEVVRERSVILPLSKRSFLSIIEFEIARAGQASRRFPRRALGALQRAS